MPYSWFVAYLFVRRYANGRPAPVAINQTSCQDEKAACRAERFLRKSFGPCVRTALMSRGQSRLCDSIVRSATGLHSILSSYTFSNWKFMDPNPFLTVIALSAAVVSKTSDVARCRTNGATSATYGFFFARKKKYKHTSFLKPNNCRSLLLKPAYFDRNFCTQCSSD